MSSDLDPLLKRLHLANTRRCWRDLIQRAEKEDWSHEALLLTMFAEEVAHRRGTRLTRAVSAAAFPFLRTIEEFDFTFQSTLRLTTIGSLLAPDFVTEGRAVILEGKPGRGKTHLAIAIAYRAMQNGFDALFTTAAELIDELSVASRGDGLRGALATYMKPHVLVVDEVGYLPYGDDAASVLYHVVNDRHIRRRAMIFTTNKHPKRWGDVLHDDDLADAIVDRVLERGRLLRLDGPSMRTKHLSADELGTDEYTQLEAARVSGKDRPEFPERTTRRPAIRRGRETTRRRRPRGLPGPPGRCSSRAGRRVAGSGAAHEQCRATPRALSPGHIVLLEGLHPLAARRPFSLTPRVATELAMPKPRTPSKRRNKSPAHAAPAILPTPTRPRPRGEADQRYEDDPKLRQGLLELLDMAQLVIETLRGEATKAELAELNAHLRSSTLASRQS